MKGYLLDSHVALWVWQGSERLSHAHRDILFSDAKRYLSVASLWEIAIKTGLGKLSPPDDLEGAAAEAGFTLLPIRPHHATAVRDLPLLHRDPFDRILIIQAMMERLTLLSVDRRFAEYGVEVV